MFPFFFRNNNMVMGWEGKRWERLIGSSLSRSCRPKAFFASINIEKGNTQSRNNIL